MHSLLDTVYGYESFTDRSIFIEKLCSQFKLIMFGDTIRIGKPFYEARLTSNECKNTQFGLQITDRFDRWINREDKQNYIQKMLLLLI